MSGMCGIVNLDGAPVNPQLLHAMTAFMAFRGPDAQDVWIDGAVGFGHALLRTTFESEHEQQPFSLDGKVWITADARIDGQAELKKKLEAQGREGLQTANDVQLILHAYHAWGEDCLIHLIGDFAFAIWDGPRQQLFCARDHFGIKPFFYARVGQSLVLSNTLNCIRQHPSVSADLDDLAIADFLLFQQLYEPNATAFVDIRRLPPAHSLSLSAGQLRINRYWQLADLPVTYRPNGDYVKRFRELLDTAVADRLRTNRVGIQMSGGLDSTAVAAITKNLQSRQQGLAELRAYAIVYDPIIPDKERHYSTLAAEWLDIPIRHYDVARYQLFEQMDRPDARRPQPFHNPLVAAHLDLSSEASRHQRVLLTGWDGDALMSESPKPYFRSLLKQHRFADLLYGMARYAISQRRLIPLGLKDRLFRRRGMAAPRYPVWLNPELEARLGLRQRWEHIYARRTNRHPVRPYAHTIFQYLADLPDCFDSYDAGVNLCPVEYRHPLMDLRLVEYCLSLPPWPWCVKKEILRITMRGLLPESVRRRPKTALVGHPHLPLLRQAQAQRLDLLVATPGLDRYVEVDKIPRVSGEENPEEAWTNMRPLSLNFWLQSLTVTQNMGNMGNTDGGISPNRETST